MALAAPPLADQCPGGRAGPFMLSLSFTRARVVCLATGCYFWNLKACLRFEEQACGGGPTWSRAWTGGVWALSPGSPQPTPCSPGVFPADSGRPPSALSGSTPSCLPWALAWCSAGEESRPEMPIVQSLDLRTGRLVWHWDFADGVK